MEIKLTKIKGRGFLSFHDPFELDLESLQGQTIQIDGLNKDDNRSESNGSGKSSLLEAINWGLYGELCRRNRYKDEVIHKQLKECHIQQTLKTNDQIWNITRHRNKQEQSLEILINGEPGFPGSTSSTKQEKLEEFLGMNFASFICTTIFGREFMAFPDLKPAERTEMLTRIRGLEHYTDASKKASDTAKSLASSVVEKENLLREVKARLEEVRKTNYRDKIEEFENEKKQLVDKLQKQLEQFEEELRSEKRELDHNVKLRGSQSMADLHQKIKIQYGKEKVIYYDLENAKTRLKEFQELGEGNCSLCGQKVTKEHLEKESNLLKYIIKMDSEKFFKIKSELAKLESESDPLDKLEAHIRGIRQSITSIESNAKHTQSLILVEEQKINPYIQMEKERVEKARKLGKQIREIKQEQDTIIYKQQIYQFWQEGFKKIKFMLFDTMVTNFQLITNQILKEYSNELEILFDTERETRGGTIKDEFHISIVDMDGEEVSYEMYSGGERQKIRLSIALGLAQMIREDCGRDFNFMAFDEPNDALDDAGKDTNFETFTELAQTGKTVLVTDHDANFKDRFDKTILVVKENKRSQIQEN